MNIICVQCDDCGRLATNELKWIRVEETKEEVLLCTCGNRKWKFVEKNSNLIGPDVLVVQKGE